MTTLRSIVVSSVLLAACSPDAPAQSQPAAAEAAPAKPPGSLAEPRLPPGDPHAVPPPGEEPPAMAMPTTTGTLDAMIDGKPVHFVHLTPGQNRAVVLPGDAVGRVSIAGAEESSGQPHLRLLIGGVRPDQLQYPITIASKPEKDAKGPSVSIRYVVHEQRIYVIDPAKGAEATVTLEGWEGTTLRGRFEGKLAPTAAALGGPIPVSGKFAVELGVQGVQPGPSAPADAAAAPVDDSTKPAETTTKPTDAPTKPAEAPTKPAEATTKPAEATAG